MDLWGWQSSMGHMGMGRDHCELMGLVVIGSPRIYGAGGHLLGYGVTDGDHPGPMGLVVLGSPQIYGAGGHLLGYGVMDGDHHGSMGLAVLYGARGDGRRQL